MDTEKGLSTNQVSTSLLSSEGPQHVRNPGHLFRFLYDPNAKGGQDGHSLGLGEIGLGLLRDILVEFIGTFLFYMFIVGSNSSSLDGFQLAISNAVLYYLLILVFGHLSGAHFNPVLTVGSVAVGRTSILRGVVYVVAQIVACVLFENMFLNSLGNSFAIKLGLCGFASSLSDFNGGYLLIYGIIMQFFLVFVSLRVAFDARMSSMLGPQSTSIIVAAAWGISVYAAVGFGALGIYVPLNPAICTASYNGFNRESVSTYNNDIGAQFAWIALPFSVLMFAVFHYLVKAPYTAGADEEQSRNLAKLRQL